MSTSTLAHNDFAARKPARSSRKVISLPLLGSAAIACLVLSCAWTVYVNIFAASVYPHLDSESFDAPVIQQPPVVAARRGSPAATRLVAALSDLASRPAAPATVAGPSLSFDDRFAAAAPQSQPPQRETPPQLAEAPKQPEVPRQAQAPRQAEAPKLAEAAKPKETAPRPAPVQVAAIAPMPAPHPEAAPSKTPAASVRDMARRAKAAVMSIASADKPSIFEKLWGKPPSRGSLLSYASADASITGSLGSSQNPALGGTEPRYDRSTAVYDISAHTVYLPDGSRLEAHSGLGSKLDDPSSANVRMRGVTPPHLYELTQREALFHGVAALRLNPVGGEEAIYGRSGLLAHTFMLGPNGDSNGCVSFRDYNAFLDAYRNQGIKRLAVVARIE
jgi:outer membrane biosynthesis protein TonB